MKQKIFFKWFFCSLAVWILSGCAYPISKGLRNEANKNLTFAEALHDPTAYTGSVVIWGGEIIKTINQTDSSEIFILDAPLDYQGMPKAAESSRGRFIAKSNQFRDPAVYKKGKKITVAGEIIGKETKPLGKMTYTYPVVKVKEIHLWESAKYRHYYDPYWDWYGPGFWPYYGGFYDDFGGGEEFEEGGERGEGGGGGERGEGGGGDRR